MQGTQQDLMARDPREAELNEYRAVSASAILGLILALVSLAAFGHPVLWCLPVVAAIVNLLALARIASQAPRLLGRSIALLGLSLSLAIGAAAPTHHWASNLRIRHEAQHVVRTWLDDVRQHRLEAAVELMLEPYRRLLPTDDPISFYRDEPRALAALRELAERPLINAIAALGMDSQVRYLETSAYQKTLHKERVVSLWAVTYKAEGNLKTILVRASVERDLHGRPGKDSWWITKVDMVTKPPAWLQP